MSIERDTPSLPFTAGADIERARLVTALGVKTAADANRDWIGVTTADHDNGDPASARMPQAGTFRVTAAAAITKGARVFKDADGKVGLTSTNAQVGIANEAASGDGSIIEVLPV